MKKLLLIVLLLGCEGILSPEFHLEGEWEQFLTNNTNTATGESVITERECGLVLRFLSDGRCLRGYRHNELDGTCDTLYYIEQWTSGWFADENHIYWHGEDSTGTTVIADVDYSIHSDTLIWSIEDSVSYHQSHYKRLGPDQLRVFWN